MIANNKQTMLQVWRRIVAKGGTFLLGPKVSTHPKKERFLNSPLDLSEVQLSICMQPSIVLGKF